MQLNSSLPPPNSRKPSPTGTLLSCCQNQYTTSHSHTRTIHCIELHRIEASAIEFSPDASLYAIADPQGISLFSTATHTEAAPRLSCPGIQALAFSPAGNYLITFQRPTKGEDGNAAPNLKVWSLSSSSSPSDRVVLAVTQKSLNRDCWPSIQFTADDSLAVRMVTNCLHGYDPSAWAQGPVVKFPVKGVAAFAITPAPGQGNTPVVAVYVPESKGSPGHAALYTMDGSIAQGAVPTPLARKSFFRANSARFYWAPTGSAVLVLTAADVDATNQSYYGEQKLYYFSAVVAANGVTEQAVPLPKEGPIHDVQWNPRGDCFVTVAGFMPAKSTVFTATCVPKFDLGSGPYSTARWNSFGRFLVLAGFGNLPGDLAFFDKKADGKLKPMGTSRAENGVSLEWSPCGRFVVAATVAPRLRVDNGVQVFSYNGTLLAKAPKDILLEGRWQPSGVGEFEDRPQSPRGNANGGASASTDAAVPIPPQPVKAAGYVPPHLRNNPAAAAAAAAAARASFSLARDPAEKGGKIAAGQTAARPSASASSSANLPPGAAPPPSKSAAKNARRRAAAAAKKKLEDDVAGMKI